MWTELHDAIADRREPENQGWYPEFIDDPFRRATDRLNPTPGLSLFASIGTGPHRGQLQCLGRAAVHRFGQPRLRTTAAGVITNIGPISSVNNNAPVSMAASTTQLMIISDGLGYVVSGGVITPMPTSISPQTSCGAGTRRLFHRHHVVENSCLRVERCDQLGCAPPLHEASGFGNDLVGGVIYNQR